MNATFKRPLKSGTIPFPLVIVDELMRQVSPSAYKVLSVTIRQTLGWRSPNGSCRKAREWISHGWFASVTGLAGQTVSNAIDELVTSGIIEVTDLLGRPKTTKFARRASRSRLYYGLAPGVLAEIQTANPWLAFEPLAVSRLQEVEQIKQAKIKFEYKANTQGPDKSRMNEPGPGAGERKPSKPSGGWESAAAIAARDGGLEPSDT